MEKQKKVSARNLRAGGPVGPISLDYIKTLFQKVDITKGNN